MRLLLAPTPAHLGWWVWVLAGSNTKGPEIMENARISHLLLQVQSRSNAGLNGLPAASLPCPQPAVSGPLLWAVVPAVTPVLALSPTAPAPNPPQPLPQAHWTPRPVAPTQIRQEQGPCLGRPGGRWQAGHGPSLGPGSSLSEPVASVHGAGGTGHQGADAEVLGLTSPKIWGLAIPWHSAGLRAPTYRWGNQGSDLGRPSKQTIR